MKEEDAGDYWCPMGRISLQQGSNQPRIDVIPAGAFNTAVTFAPGSQAHGAKRYPSRCIGRECAFWEKNPWWGKYGQCGLVATSQSLWPIGIVAVCLIATLVFLTTIKFSGV